MDRIIGLRNFLLHIKYRWVWRPIFFRIDPETIHELISATLRFCGRFLLTRNLTRFFFGYSHPALRQKVLGIEFNNPVGLAAGFDKNAELTDIMPALGFGFTEVGSITGEPCAGNPKPRLWRLKKSKSLQVYYGLKNEGSEFLARKLAGKKFSLPVGISIAKTNCQATAEDEPAIADYFKAYQAFHDIGDYCTINISCPNAYGGQPFTDPGKLEKLLEKIFSVSKTKPVFLKLSPDLSHDEIGKILEVCKKFSIDGFICTNLTKDRYNGYIRDKNISPRGGISGKAIADLSTKMIRYIYRKTQGRYVIIGLGGIFNAEDAYEKIKAGATLLQLITGMIYEGPQAISDINLGLVKLLQKDGYKNISEAIGKEK